MLILYVAHTLGHIVSCEKITTFRAIMPINSPKHEHSKFVTFNAGLPYTLQSTECEPECLQFVTILYA